jgi:uncharacterized protein (TIGR02466 family)
MDQVTRIAGAVTWESIFPVPVMRSNIGRRFTGDELQFFERARQTARPNVTNARSVDTRVLDAPELAALKEIVVEHVRQFAWKVISAHPKHDFYLTQSWLNFTRSGQSHFRHFHTNSLISGALYVNALAGTDRICFFRNSPLQILVSDDQNSPYSATVHRVDVNVGDIVLFPSWLTHEVETTTGSHLRTSLAFNAFVKGELGSEGRLNALTL